MRRKLKYSVERIISKNENAKYLANVIYRSKDPAFRQYCIDYKNPRNLHFRTLGDENPNRNIYLIKVGSSAVGMFSLITWTLRYLEFADRFQLTPVVSWNKEIAFYEKDNIFGLSNPYEMFFRQVSDVSEKSAKISSNVAISRGCDSAYSDVLKSYDFSDDEIIRLAHIYAKYLQLQPWAESEIESNKRYLLKDASVLGVHVRGADWRRMKIFGHPIAASEDDYIDSTRRMMVDGQFSKIFLATDSDSTVEKFRDAFGELLLYYPDTARTHAESSALAIFNKQNAPYRLGLEVLRDVFTLVACDALIAGISYVSYAARIIKNSRRQLYCKMQILDKGLRNKSGLNLHEAVNLQKNTENNK